MDENFKLETAYKSELGSRIKDEQDLQKRNDRLELMLDAGRTWNTKRETLKMRLKERKRVLASERSSWDANRSILQSNLDIVQEEVWRVEKIQLESSQHNEEDVAKIWRQYQEDIMQEYNQGYLGGYTVRITTTSGVMLAYWRRYKMLVYRCLRRLQLTRLCLPYQSKVSLLPSLNSR